MISPKRLEAIATKVENHGPACLTGPEANWLISELRRLTLPEEAEKVVEEGWNGLHDLCMNVPQNWKGSKGKVESAFALIPPALARVKELETGPCGKHPLFAHDSTVVEYRDGTKESNRVCRWCGDISDAQQPNQRLQQLCTNQRQTLAKMNRKYEATKGSYQFQLAKCNARVAELERKSESLVDAGKNLLEACYQADAREELPHEIDGALIDSMRKALMDAPVSPLIEKNEKLVARVAELEAVVRGCADELLRLHPTMNPDEPCTTYETYQCALAALKEVPKP